MTKDTEKEYRDTMQELMLELKLSTHKFLKKVGEKSENFEYEDLAIPVTISFKGDSNEFEIDVFGLGEKIQSTLMLYNDNLKNVRAVNSSVVIMEGVTFLHGKKQFFNENVIEKSEYKDNNYILFISKKILGSEIDVNSISKWMFEKILKKDCKFAINGVDVLNEEDIQIALSGNISNHMS
ncbi:MAG: hypothetical protein HKP34_01395 [Nitrosopumilus sp.]|nr:hypothetical protein [Nitrosopumilus sp.]NNL36942.1 hypothetical protein [Nitrosopumilus sp.]